MTALWNASRLPVLRRPFLGLVAVAILLVLVTVPVLDDGYATAVLQGVAVLLAAAMTATADDPSGEVLAASPWPRRTRFLVRVSVGLVVTVPVWLLACGLAQWRMEQTPVLGLSLQAAALAAVSLAIAAVLWSRGVMTPSWVAMTAVVGVGVLIHSLPRAYAMFGTQPWGPPWQAALLRWAALLVLACAVLSLAVRDPWATRTRHPRAIASQDTALLDEPTRPAELAFH